jgi:lipopolysaccharide transport system ATP-binding protein
MSSETAIRVERISKRYLIGATQGFARYRTLREDIAKAASPKRREKERQRELWALKDVTFEIQAGETVGVIGRNGAGKSTLLKLLAGITSPTSGRGETFGRVASLLEVGTGFQGELTGRENIFLAAAIMGMRRAETLSRFDEIVAFAGLEKFIDTPVKRYSSGMYMRLAFSVAAHLDPEILLVDEVLAVGDAEFQKRCLGRMGELTGAGRTVLFVSHSIPSILRLCPRVILLDGGRLTADGAGPEVVDVYMGREGGSAFGEWPDIQSAPGDDRVRLRSIAIRNPKGELAPEVNIADPVSVEVEYLNLCPDPDFRPTVALSFYNTEGTCAFVTWDMNNLAWRDRPRGRQAVRTRCQIPGHFLAEGGLSVLIEISSYGPTAHHVSEHDAAMFHVVDPGDGEGVRGAWVGDWPGVVRPMLAWETESEPIA